jgi:hypothetical protein
VTPRVDDGAPVVLFPDQASFESWLEQLIVAGRTRPAGIAEIEAAQADGRRAAAYRGTPPGRR